MYVFVPRSKRALLRRLTVESWQESGQDVAIARQIVKRKVEGYGSVIFWLTLVSIVLQIAYYAFKLWDERKVKDPGEIEQDYEPFKIASAA